MNKGKFLYRDIDPFELFQIDTNSYKEGDPSVWCHQFRHNRDGYLIEQGLIKLPTDYVQDMKEKEIFYF